MAKYKDELYNMPFNMNTFNKLWGVFTPEEAQESGRWGKDNVCIPHSFGNLNQTSGTSEYVPEDIGRAIYLHMGENIHQDVRAVCNKIIALNEKIKEYERGTYIQELLKSEEMLLKLKEALQKLREV